MPKSDRFRSFTQSSRTGCWPRLAPSSLILCDLWRSSSQQSKLAIKIQCLQRYIWARWEPFFRRRHVYFRWVSTFESGVKCFEKSDVETFTEKSDSFDISWNKILAAIGEWISTEKMRFRYKLITKTNHKQELRRIVENENINNTSGTRFRRRCRKRD